MTDLDRGTARTVAPAVALAVLLAALTLVFWPPGLDQFDLPKLLVLVSGVPVVAALLLMWRAQCGGRMSAAGLDTPLLVLVAALTFWSIGAPLWHAQNRLLHLLGSAHAILLTALFCVAVAVRHGASQRALRLLESALFVPALVVSAFALTQAFGVDPLRLVLDLASSRPGRWQALTTLGNPTWTAEVIVVSFAFAMIALDPKRGNPAQNRWLRLSAALLMTAGVAATGSRAGLAGLAVSATVVCILEQRTKGVLKGVLKAAMVGMGLGVVGICVALGAGVDRLAEVTPITGRLALWAAGVQVFVHAPLGGHGIGHTALVLPGGLEWVVSKTDPDLVRWLPTMLVDRLDNDLLQVAVERGIPAAILVLAVWLRAVWLTGRRAWRGGSPLDAASTASLLVVGFFSLVSAPLHTPATAAIFWVLVGWAATPGAGSIDQWTRRRWRGWPSRAAAALCGVAWLVAGAGGIRVLRADTLAGEGHRLLLAGQPGRAAERLEAALQRLPWMTAASIDRARALLAAGQPAEALVAVDDGRQWAESAWFWVVEAQALSQLGLPDQATRVLDQAFKVLPESPLLRECRETIRQP